ncbi:hypothetical protein GCM10010102_34320 [Promicromonospora citrea]|uniref:Uncharacterized protein n=1 Tax=Promicromonospora citrea TaxID=43677 RepID=A0A8H9GMP1_9MICO|nr:hypothetical protein GCM10010102_34320 [Promicromonospora citrea]
MNDVDRLLAQCSWLAEDISVGGPPEQHRPVKLPGLPAFSRLLSTATTTPVRIDGVGHELLAWGPAAARRGWLCRSPEPDDNGAEVPETLRSVWTATGGIVGHFGEPTSPWWWINCDAVLTREAAGSGVDGVFAAYRWMWTDEGLEVPVKSEDFVVVATEANGNLTLAHRRTGEIIWFAPDHAESGVSVLPGCPEYTLYTFDAAPDLPSWVEAGATQWGS